jgi:hypothetical protein
MNDKPQPGWLLKNGQNAIINHLKKPGRPLRTVLNEAAPGPVYADLAPLPALEPEDPFKDFAKAVTGIHE